MPRPTQHAPLLRVMAALLAGALALTALPVTALADPTSQELGEQADKLAEEREELTAQREALEGQLADAQVRLEELGEQIAAIQAELMEAEERLEDTRNQIAETSAQIEATRSELAERREALGTHMRGSYKMGSTGMIDTLMGATSFEDLINRIYYLDKISEQSATDISEIDRLEGELTAHEAELEEQQARQQDEIEATEAKMAEYEAKVAEAQEFYAALDAEVQEALAAEEAKRAEEEAKRAEQEEAKKAEDEAARRAEEARRAAIEAMNAGGDQQPVEAPAGSSDVVANAYALIGRPYKTWWSGRNYGPDAPGYDCCGLAATAYQMAGYSTPYQTPVTGLMSWVRSRGNWRDCNLSNVDSVLNPGDLLFCSTGHVAIYIGNGQMIHAPYPGRYVCVAPIYACIGGGFGG